MVVNDICDPSGNGSSVLGVLMKVEVNNSTDDSFPLLCALQEPIRNSSFNDAGG